MEPGWNLDSPLGLIEEQRKHSVALILGFSDLLPKDYVSDFLIS